MNFDVVIDTPEHSVDMKSGLDTLQGASEATRTIADTILTGRVPQRQSHRSPIRTSLKRSFKGSYGHVFSLDIYDPTLKRKFNRIGRATFAEIMAYFISESLYLDSSEISDKAHQIIETLGDNSEKLIKQLRVSSLENIHEISTKFNHDVTVRYRKNRSETTTLANFNKSTVLALQAKESDETIDIIGSITRLNIYTGNGRLQLKDGTETVAFGFSSRYKDVRLKAKKKFSENLDHNNGLSSDRWEYLRIVVKPVRLRDEKIVKYIVTRYYDD